MGIAIIRMDTAITRTVTIDPIGTTAITTETTTTGTVTTAIIVTIITIIATNLK
jgi:hypothetical protein